MKIKSLIFAGGVVVLTIAASFKYSGESFKIIGANLKEERIKSDDKLDISQIDFINTSDTALRLNWRTVENSFPAKWDFLCVHMEIAR